MIEEKHEISKELKTVREFEKAVSSDSDKNASIDEMNENSEFHIEVKDGANNGSTHKNVEKIDDGIESCDNFDVNDVEIDDNGEVGDVKNDSESIPVFMRDDWKRRVEDFEKEYPIASEFGKEIGETILNSDTLKNDDECLYKALLKVMSDRYLPDAEKAKDSAFLQNYIYADENIVAKIVGDYIDSLSERRLPRTMTKGGQISLTQPNRPRTVSEAGRIAERIMKR